MRDLGNREKERHCENKEEKNTDKHKGKTKPKVWAAAESKEVEVVAETSDEKEIKNKYKICANIVRNVCPGKNV